MIKIKKDIYNDMIGHAKRSFPNEACGILAGSSSGDDKIVSEFFPMKNVDESSISYFMDPREQLQVFKQIRRQGLTMLGIFHSHVASEAFPSQKDVRLAFYPEVSYLIVSLSDMEKPVLRSFHIQNEKAGEEDLSIL